MPANPSDWRRLVEHWLRRSQGGPPPAVVLGASATGLSFARSLGRHGVPVLLLEDKMLLGMFTRYADCVLLAPHTEAPDAWLEVLEFAGTRLAGPAVLLPTTDGFSRLAAQHAARLAAFYRMLGPELATLERIIDKRLQYAAAEAAGLSVPCTYYPTSAAEVRQVAAAVQYPCLLKPCVAHLGRRRLAGGKVLVAGSPAELTAGYERLATAEMPFMVQEVVPGDERHLYGYVAFWDAAGQEAAAFIMRKLRQHPPQYGDGSLMLSENEAEVAELSRRLLRAFHYRGYAGVEFKRDERDGKYRLIEMNPRCEAFVEMAIGAGVDLPWIGYQALLGADCGPHPAFRGGVKYVNEEFDLLAFQAYRASGQLTLSHWLGSLRDARPIVWAWDDPRPLLTGLGRWLAKRHIH